MLERRSAMAFATMLVLAGSQPAAAATVTLDAELQGDAIDVHASAVLNADAATAWRVLTDYDRYAEFIPDLRMSRVVARDGTRITVRSHVAGPVASAVTETTHEILPQPRLRPGRPVRRRVTLVRGFRLRDGHHVGGEKHRQDAGRGSG